MAERRILTRPELEKLIKPIEARANRAAMAFEIGFDSEEERDFWKGVVALVVSHELLRAKMEEKK